MRNRLGFSVVEIIVSVAVISVVSSTLLPTIGWLVTKSQVSKTSQQGGVLLMEGIEVAYNVLQSDWMIGPGVYHPAVGVDVDERPIWNLVSGGEDNLEAKFGREISILDICRDVDTGAELSCDLGGEVDVNSKRVTTVVLWRESGKTKRLEASLLIANLGP
ncbi:MAG: hypothetical protein AAB909_02585 [Patescibacteria group bacterium]